MSFKPVPTSLSTTLIKPLLRLYKAILFLLTPIWFLWILMRLGKGKEDGARLKERWATPTEKRPEGNLIWIHAASVGESLSALPLIKRLQEVSSDLHILVTTGTITSAKLMTERLPSNVIHQYIPFDMIFFVNRFLNYWNPQGVLWLESELWPTFLSEIRNRRIPAALINARLSSKSFHRWGKIPAIAYFLLTQFNLCLAQSSDMAIRLKNLGARHVRMPGNLKYASPPLPVSVDDLASLRHEIGKRPLWCAASTHPGEEELIAQAHTLIKKKIPNILTLLIPRHPERGMIIHSKLLGDKLNITRRTVKESISPETDIYVADTLGELGLFFRLSPIVFVGGSLVPVGGHNPLEPALLDSALLWGPHMGNFAEMSERFLKDNAALKINDAPHLAEQVLMLLDNSQEATRMMKAARDIAKSESKVLDRIIEDIEPFFSCLKHPAIPHKKQSSKSANDPS
jgi:3-deoxy-D-manno-octulosonic-acid transferase